VQRPADDHPGRVAVRSLLAEHPAPTARQLAEAGLVCPHWPRPWGLDADPVAQLAVDEELAAAGIVRPENQIGTGWAGPTIVAAGSPEQQARFLPPLLAGEEIWCQLFSEPEAGSDLASLRTTATRDGDEYVLQGQKIWTTWADHADFGILLARTDASAPKHKGISYFLLPMDRPGITVRPIREMSGGWHFNEVFLDEVRVPAANRVGEEGDGWRLAVVTLGNERVSLSGEGALWGHGPSADDLLQKVKANGGVDDPVLRQQLAKVWIEGEVLRLIRLRTVTAAVQGRPPGPEASIRKALSDEHGQHIMGLAKDLAGTNGLLLDHTPFEAEHGVWDHGFAFAPALTIGGGTAQVQRNIIAEMVLGMPREIDVEKGRSWAEARAAVNGART
jgi:alkylation response protein AidB-like acyl-CoA dehydrogenase